MHYELDYGLIPTEDRSRTGRIVGALSGARMAQASEEAYSGAQDAEEDL